MKLKVVNGVVEIEASEIEESLLIKYIDQKMLEAVTIRGESENDPMLEMLGGNMYCFREGWLGCKRPDND